MYSYNVMLALYSMKIDSVYMTLQCFYIAQFIESLSVHTIVLHVYSVKMYIYNAS